MEKTSSQTRKRQLSARQKSNNTQSEDKYITGRPNNSTFHDVFTHETTFQPQVTKHMKMLTEAASAEEKTRVVTHLQQSYGNQYVQSLINSIKAQTTISTIETEIQRQPEEEEEEIPQITLLQRQEEEEEVPSPPEEEEVQASPLNSVAAQTSIPPSTRDREKEQHTSPQNVDLHHQPPPVLVPVNPANAAGCVIVKNGAFDMYINPKNSKCVVGGVIVHEMKHILDFMNDTYYKTIPMSGKIPDGETFYYQSTEDQKRFEYPAIDMEIEWLKKQLEGNPPEADMKIMQRRMTVTLPAYRASFG